jgi:geranylgeranyl diphosphate synthase type II
MKFNDYLKTNKGLIDKTLDRLLPAKGKLAKAMRYSIFAGGKRFRPILCLATAEALGVEKRALLPYACALEMVHTFTLVHDDLPAMDNSDFRRGKPTNHKVFGEGLAVLAGDALNTLAFKIIAFQPEAASILAEALLKVVEGQVSDIEISGRVLSKKNLLNIHQWKTGSLLKAAVLGGAIICNAKKNKIRPLIDYACHLGLAFQIADDILDVTATRQQMGKPVGADQKKGFPYFFGLANAQQMAELEKEKALEAISRFDRGADRLRQLAEFVIKRSS